MISYLHNSIFKVNIFQESPDLFGLCDRSDPHVAIKTYRPGTRLSGLPRLWRWIRVGALATRLVLELRNLMCLLSQSNKGHDVTTFNT